MTARSRSPRSRRRRLDALLVERGLASDADEARRLVLARRVRVNGATAPHPANVVDAGSELALEGRRRYASRGGEKLEHALARSGVDPRGARCLDVGASTGGFTDCLLQHGAVHVVAVDVAYGELAAHLREDPRVEVRERTHARDLQPLQPPVDLAVADVSFISLTAVLPALRASLRPGGDALVLVKPQFEAPREAVEPGGVVRDAARHGAAVGAVAAWAVRRGFRMRGVVRSPLLGPAGNREFFLHLRRTEASA